MYNPSTNSFKKVAYFRRFTVSLDKNTKFYEMA